MDLYFLVILKIIVVSCLQTIAMKTSSAARRANRVVSVAQMELDNSEDPQYIATLTIPVDDLSGSKCRRVNKVFVVDNLPEASVKYIN